jgi:hypothetical protein
MACSGCGADKTFARGFCQACYWRLRRNGTIERKNVVNQGKCSVVGCDKDAFAKNLCSFHYQRAQPPLKNVWKLLRSRARGAYPPKWDDFAGFLEDIGIQPSVRHQLRRPDPTIPWSKNNMVWREPIDGGKQNRTLEEKRVYTRTWDMRKKYNLSREQYNAMRQQQEDKCAICGAEETARDRLGQIRPLAIDHDHRTSKVRELICHRCNALLGWADDDAGVLQKAIAYLEKHAATPLPPNEITAVWIDACLSALNIQTPRVD